MLDLNMSELQCIRRALGDFISSKENSVYDFSFYVDIHKKINDEIYKKENIKLTDIENGEMKIWKRKREALKKEL